MKVYDDKTVAHIFMGQFLACHVLCNNLIRREQMQNAEATIFILFHLLLLQMRSFWQRKQSLFGCKKIWFFSSFYRYLFWWFFPESTEASRPMKSSFFCCSSSFSMSPVDVSAVSRSEWEDFLLSPAQNTQPLAKLGEQELKISKWYNEWTTFS